MQAIDPSPSTSTTQRFNRIVANPPYVAIGKLHPTLQQSVSALGTHDDGSFAIRSNYWCAFLSACLRVLANHGSYTVKAAVATAVADGSERTFSIAAISSRE